MSFWNFVIIIPYLFEYWMNSKRKIQILSRYSRHTFNADTIRQVYVHRYITACIYDDVYKWNSMNLWNSYSRIYICRLFPSFIVTSHGRHVFSNHRQPTISSCRQHRKFQSSTLLAVLNEPTGHRWIPSQTTSIAESVSMSWRRCEWPMMTDT